MEWDAEPDDDEAGSDAERAMFDRIRDLLPATSPAEQEMLAQLQRLGAPARRASRQQGTSADRRADQRSASRTVAGTTSGSSCSPSTGRRRTGCTVC